MAQNKFLQDFMRTQNRLLEIEANDKSVKKDRKGNRKAVHKTASGAPAFGDDDELARIIKERPPKKEIIDYFRKRIGELIAADMS